MLCSGAVISAVPAEGDSLEKKYYLSKDAALKWLELPSVYNIATDELYELDGQAFELLKRCAGREGCSVRESEFLDFCLGEGLLVNEEREGSVIPLRQSPVPSLRYLELQITHRCNLRCRHCYIGEKNPKDLDIETIRRILGEFEDMQGLRVLITGGEPLLHPRFDELNSLLPDFAVRKILFTNGLLLDEGRIKDLMVHEIQVSIDGLEEGHDWIRGKGTFAKAIRGIEAALDAGFGVSISTMVHARNLNDFPGMEKLFKKLGIKDWTVDVPCETGTLGENPGLVPPPETAGRYLNFGFGKGPHGGGEGYACGSHLMCLFPDGRSAKCGFYAHDTVGDCKEGLDACWKRIRHLKLDELECDCRFIEVCRGGCRFRATVIAHAAARDPYRCAGLHAYQAERDDP